MIYITINFFINLTYMFYVIRKIGQVILFYKMSRYDIKHDSCIIPQKKKKKQRVHTYFVNHQKRKKVVSCCPFSE